MAHVFISYTREDEKYALKLVKRLKREGIEAWVDKDILGGDHWWEVIVEKLKTCSAFIVIKSLDSQNSRWVQIECFLAVQWDKKIIPLCLSGDPGDFAILAGIQEIDVTKYQLPNHPFYKNLREYIQSINPEEYNLNDPLVLEAIQNPPPSGEKIVPLKHISSVWSVVLKYLRDPIWQAVGVFLAVFLAISAQPIIIPPPPITLTPSDTPSPTETAAPTITPSDTPTATDMPTITPSITHTVTATPTATATLTGTPSLTPEPEAFVIARRGVTNNQEWTIYPTVFHGMEMVLVPADAQCVDATSGCVSAPFWVNRFEITNEMIKRQSSVLVIPRSSRWNNNQHPRERITWYEASQFCSLYGGKLPTEEEWLYAARGTNQLLTYPWGANFVAANVIYAFNSNNQTHEVGSSQRAAGASWVGAYDMSGNVREWTSTVSGNSSNAYVVKGGSWSGFADDLQLMTRPAFFPTYEDSTIGFRCAIPLGNLR